MAEERLVFPIGFDLDGGIDGAVKDWDKAQRRLQKTIDGKPLTLNVDTKDVKKFEAYTKSLGDSIDEIRDKMKSLTEQWASLPNEAKFDAGGRLTDDAQKIVSEYNQLAVSLETYGKTLQRISTDARKSAEEELRQIERNRQSYQKYITEREKSQKELLANERAYAAQVAAYARQEMDELYKKNSLTEKGLNIEARIRAEKKAQIDQREKEYRLLKEQIRVQSEIAAKEKKAQADMANMEKQANYNKAKQAGLERLKTLKATENTIANITAKLQIQQQRLQTADFGSKKFMKIAAEVKRLSESLSEANDKVRRLTGSFDDQYSYVKRLTTRLGVYFSLFQAFDIVRGIRDTTAEFELQRVALGALIQDGDKAKEMFSQIKEAAVVSPFQIKDLVSFTKQLAAYRVEQEKLFPTMMQLADISAGLGVSMDRLVLAYGQVKAAAVLRGTELRQFTEAGIPLVDLLAEKFSELRGEVVSAAEVFDFISKRAVSFEMVEDIFNDMTSAGGMFYDMQRKQADTLAGMWSNLKDSIAIAYDEIGRTRTVNAGMKILINTIKSLWENWDILSSVIFSSATALLSYKIAAGNATKALVKLKSVGNIFSKSFLPVAALTTVVSLLSDFVNSIIETREAIKESMRQYEERNEQIIKLKKSYSELNAELESGKAQFDGFNAKLVQLNKIQKTMESMNLRFQIDFSQITEANIDEEIQSWIDKLQEANDVALSFSTTLAKRENKSQGRVFGVSLFGDNLKRDVKQFNDAMTGIQEKIQGAGKINDAIKRMRNYIAEAALENEALYKRMSDIVGLDISAAFDVQQEGETTYDFIMRISEAYNKLRYSTLNQTLELPKFNTNAYFVSLQEMLYEFESIKEQMRGEDPMIVRMAIDKEFLEREWPESVKQVLIQEWNKDGFKIPLVFDPKPAAETLSNIALDLNKVFGEDAIKGINLGGIGNIQELTENVRKNIKSYTEQLKELDGVERKLIKTNEYTDAVQRSILEKRKRLQADLELTKSVADLYNISYTTTGSTGGEDPWILLMKNRMKFMQDFQKGVEDLNKKMFISDALKREQDIMRQRGMSVEIDVDTQMGTADELSKWFEDAIAEVQKKISSLGGAKFAGLGVEQILSTDTKNKTIKAYQELLQTLFTEKTNFETSQAQKALQKEIETLAQKVSRSKEAQGFFENMLGLTGDEELSATLTMNVYGDTGSDLKKNLQDQLVQAFNGIDISAAFSTDGGIDYTMLEDLISKLPSDLQKNARSLVNEGIKSNAEYISDLYKTYQDFKTFEERKTEIVKREELARKKIKESNLSEQEKEKFMQASKTREKQDVAAVGLEQLKSTDDWARTFENVERVGTAAIRRLMESIREYIALSGKDLTPEQLKALTKQYQTLYDEVITRDPFRTISESMQRMSLISSALRAQKSIGGEAYNEMLDKIRAFNKEAEETGGKIIDITDLEGELRAAIEDAGTGVESISAAMSGIQSIFSEIGNIGDVLGIDDASSFNTIIESIGNGLGMIVSVLGVINTIITLINTSMLSNPIFLALTAITVAVSAVVGTLNSINEKKIERLNDSIEEQERLIENLEKAYDRLGNAAEEAFGTEYLEMYQQRLRILAAEQLAYIKQAELADEKARTAKKKKDKEDAQEEAQGYRDQANEVMDTILETEKELEEKLAGSSLGNAAKELAQAWIDAYKSFSSTSEAISEKFQEMLENMIVESVLGEVMKKALQPVYDLIGDAESTDFYDVDYWKKVVEQMQKAGQDADTAGKIIMDLIEQAGINLKDTGEGLTGISKDIATASEESILGLAAGINTQNFYISGIYTYVAQIAAMMQGSTAIGQQVNLQDLITIQNQHLSSLPNIELNTANTVAECRNILYETRRIANSIDKVIKPQGTAASHSVAVTIR